MSESEKRGSGEGSRFIPAADLYRVAGQALEVFPDGAVRSAPGNMGYVLFGPYIAASDGVYRIRVRGQVEGGPSVRSYFNVFDPENDGNVYAARRFHDEPEVFVRLYRTQHLEFRFECFGEALTLQGVEIEALLLDCEPASAKRLQTLAIALIEQEAEPAAVFRVIDRLAHVGEVVAAERLRTGYVAAGLNLDSEADAAQALRALRALDGERSDSRRGGRLFAQSAESATAALPIRAEILRLLWPQTFTVHDGVQLVPETRAALSKAGYRAGYFTATRLHRDYNEPVRLWHEQCGAQDPGVERPPRNPLFERYVDIDRSFQASLAGGEGIAGYCPLSGKLLRSKHGFIQHYMDIPFTFYRFQGDEVFYICTGHISNTKLFIYLPATKIIVWICDHAFRNYPAHELVSLLEINLANNIDAVRAYLTQATRPAAVIGNNIYGHFFWMCLSGLDYALRSDLAAPLAALIKLDRQFIEPSIVFPELGHLPRPGFKGDADAFRYGVEHGLVPIHFTDISMSPGLIERLQRLALERQTQRGKAPLDAPRPLIWINLRAHTKVWRGQAEGYAQILNAIYDEYGAAAGFVDGMPDCKDVADAIRALTRPEVPLYDGLDLSFYDTLSWAMRVDAFISVISSGLLIVNVLARRPGVAHAEHQHLTQMDWWRTISRGAPPPKSPSPDQIIEHGGHLYCDYDVDWRVLLDLLRPILDEAFARDRPPTGEDVLSCGPVAG